MTLEEYWIHVDALISGTSEHAFMHNGSSKHAAIVIERMFAHAKEEMCILTRRMDHAIYENVDVINQIKNFASRSGTKTHILVEEISDESLEVHGLYKLAEVFESLKIKRVAPGTAKDIKFNFSVMDKRGTRFEEDKTEARALVRFNDELFAKKCAKFFERIWNAEESIPVKIN